MDNPFYHYKAEPLERSLLARQMDPKIRSGIEFPSPGKVTQGLLDTKKYSENKQLLQSILQGITPKDCATACNFFETRKDEINCFITTWQLTPEEVQLRWQLCVDIVTVIRHLLKHCDATVFGSLLTELADSNSDINISLDPYGDNGKSLQGHSKQYEKERVSNCLNAIGHALIKAKSPHFRNECFVSKVEPKETDKVTSLQIRLRKFNVQVQLSIGNHLWLEGSKLLQFYLKYDPRVKHLIVFLRYWAKFHGLLATDKISQYAINSLVIVYLAMKKIVPSVLLLQALADLQRGSEHPKLTQGWDASFCSDLKRISTHFQFQPTRECPAKETYSENLKQKFVNLLTGFFSMISKTDFSSVVVSPQLGKIVPKTELCTTAISALNQFPENKLLEWRKDQWQRLSENDKGFSVPLNIQDSFELSHNVTDHVSKENLDKFLEASKSTLKTLKVGTYSLLDIFTKQEGNQVKRRQRTAPATNGIQILKITSSITPPRSPQDIPRPSEDTLKFVESTVAMAEAGNTELPLWGENVLPPVKILTSIFPPLKMTSIMPPLLVSYPPLLMTYTIPESTPVPSELEIIPPFSLDTTTTLPESEQLSQEIFTEFQGDPPLVTSFCGSLHNIRFYPERGFISKYANCLVNHKLISATQPSVKQQLKWQLTTLWTHLAVDFLDNLFKNNLNLNVVYATTTGPRPKKLSGAKSDLKTEVELLTKLKDSLMALPSPPVPPHRKICKGISVEVDYQFWDENKRERFSPFKINVLASVETWKKEAKEWPSITFLVQEGASEKAGGDESGKDHLKRVDLAINGILEAIRKNFPAYQEAQLEQWLQQGGDLN